MTGTGTYANKQLTPSQTELISFLGQLEASSSCWEEEESFRITIKSKKKKERKEEQGSSGKAAEGCPASAPICCTLPCWRVTALLPEASIRATVGWRVPWCPSPIPPGGGGHLPARSSKVISHAAKFLSFARLQHTGSCCPPGFYCPRISSPLLSAEQLPSGAQMRSKLSFCGATGDSPPPPRKLHIWPGWATDNQIEGV